MASEIGEYIVGAYLRIILGCEFISYNVRRLEGSTRGLNEIDVIGLDLDNNTAYLCEVTTHIRGLLYKDNQTTIERIKKKYKNLKDYAKEYLPHFEIHYMFWSPIVSEGYLTDNLINIKGLELIINSDYTKCVNELRERAKIMSNDSCNPFFRTLQILERLKEE
jgi:hypothetical protein